MTDLLIFGRQPVSEALASGAPLRKILVAQGTAGSPISNLMRQAEQHRIPLRTLPRPELDRLAKTGKHQGVVAVMAGVDYVEVETLLAKAERDPSARKAALLLLDGVEDPRNLGAILRVAEGAGLHGVVITKRRCAEVTAVTIKTSAGAAFHVPIAQVSNLAVFMESLKKRGWWIAGCDANAGDSIFALNANLPLAIVLGGEGKGLHRLVREKCDFLYKIPMAGKLASLNVATAAAIVSYEIVRQRMMKAAASK